MKILFSFLSTFLLTATLVFGAHHEESAPEYPLDVCIVSGEDLGSMGDPIIYWHKVEGQPDREVQFCCERCESRFESNPDKYLAKLDAAQSVAGESCCADETCCADGGCAACADGTCDKPCCADGECAGCAIDAE